MKNMNHSREILNAEMLELLLRTRMVKLFNMVSLIHKNADVFYPAAAYRLDPFFKRHYEFRGSGRIENAERMSRKSKRG